MSSKFVIVCGLVFFVQSAFAAYAGFESPCTVRADGNTPETMICDSSKGLICDGAVGTTGYCKCISGQFYNMQNEKCMIYVQGPCTYDNGGNPGYGSGNSGGNQGRAECAPGSQCNVQGYCECKSQCQASTNRTMCTGTADHCSNHAAGLTNFLPLTLSIAFSYALGYIGLR